MAAGSAYNSISSTTVSSNTTSVTISSIPSTYTDLILVCTMRGTINGVYPTMQFNGDTGTNYSQVSACGVATTTLVSQRYYNNSSIEILDPNRAVAYDSNAFGTSIVHLNNYSNTSIYKTAINRGSSTNPSTSGFNVTAFAGVWRSTSAINSITILSEAGGSYYFAIGSSFNLFGIKAA
jgi:hypothetical protein